MGRGVVVRRVATAGRIVMGARGARKVDGREHVLSGEP